MKKRGLIFTCFCIMLSVCACKKDVEESVDAPYFDAEDLTVNKPQYAADGYEFPVEASDNVVWTAKKEGTDTDWLTLDSFEGTGSGKVVFSLDENTLPASRTAEITVDAAVESIGASWRKTVTVIQIGTAPMILVSPEGKVNIPFKADDALAFEITSNIKWSASVAKVSGDDGWISIKSGQSGENSGQIVLNVLENATSDSRTATLTVTADEYPDVTVSIEIEQGYSGMQFTMTIPGMSGYLPDGEAVMTLSDGSGLDVTISSDGTGTSLSFYDMLSAGEHTVESVTSGGSDYAMGALIEVDAAGAVIKVESWDQGLSAFGGDTPERPLKIEDFADFEALRTAVNSGISYSGKYIAMTADITMTDTPWDGIGSEERPFDGIFDGGGFKVDGMIIESDNMTPHALFNAVKGTAGNRAVVQNLTIGENSSVHSTDGYVSSVAALVSDYSDIRNCVNYAPVTGEALSGNGSKKIAGMVSNAYGVSIVIENCVNHADVTATHDSNNVNDAGGLIGNARSGSSSEHIIVRNCRNYGTCSFAGNSGGILGNIDENTDVLRCANYGAIYSYRNSMRVGGVVGSVDVGSDIEISECFNKGNFDGLVNSGGVVGFIRGKVHVTNCYNKGEIKLNGNANTGGVVGHVNDANPVVSYCYNASDFVSKNGVSGTGGVAGMNTAGNISCVSYCYYESGRGFVKGAGNNTDAPGVVEALSAEQMTSGTPFSNWDTDIWNFTAGEYPSLKNNPED